jgi:hypothetical protein
VGRKSTCSYTPQGGTEHRFEDYMKKYLLKLFFYLSVLFVVSSYAGSKEDPQVKGIWVSVVKLVNSSTHNVYGHYEVGNYKGTVGVIAAGKSASLDLVSFLPRELAKVNFRCDKADLFNCAVGKVDVTKFHPDGNYKNVTTVFTFVKMGEVVLSFEVFEPNSDAGSYKEIIIGSVSD